MSKLLLLMISVLCTLLLFGCYNSDTTTNREGSAPTNRASPAASAAEPASTPSTGEKIGVAECDAFITAYEACVNDKVPATARTQFNATLAAWRKSWHEVAANPQTRPTLAQICKTSHDQAKQSMKAYGCTF